MSKIKSPYHFATCIVLSFVALLFLAAAGNAATYYSKAAATDFTNVTSWGDQTNGSGLAPGSISSADDFIIQNGAAMNLSAGSASVRTLTINAGSLTVSSNSLTVAIVSQNNSTMAVNSGGTLTVLGGTIVLNGNLLVASGATFNQSAGQITVDGNNAGVSGTSVSSGTVLVSIRTAIGTVNGGTMTIVDPPATGTARSFEINLTTGTPQWTGHTLRLGDGTSTDSSINASGFQFDTYVGSGGTQAMVGNLIIDGGSGTNRFATTTSASANGSFVKGDLTINTGSELRDVASGGTLVVSGNITNNGTLTKASTVLALATYVTSTLSANPNAQTISGTGVYRNSTSSSTANFTTLTINNSNASGVTFGDANSLISGINTGTVSGTFTCAAGVINTGSNAFILGASTSVLGTLTYTAGGFTSGSTFGRWYAAATAGTTITAATLPTVSGTTGSYPFLIGTNARNFFVNRPSTTGATGGVIRISHTTGAGLATIATVTDGAYNIDRQTIANWTVSTSNGFAAGTGTFSYAVSGQGTFASGNGNNRVMKAASVVGTHQTGTSLPHAQRITIPAADYLGTFYLGVSSAELPVVSVQSGAWDDPATWGGSAPVCGSTVVIANGHIVTVSGAPANAGPVTVNSGGTLAVSGNTLTVGCTLNNTPLTNNGTLTVTGGTVNVNGNVVLNTGSTFNQSAGSIVVDGNAAGVVGNSVASGTVLFSILSNLGSVTGGSLTIVDPPAAGTARSLSYSSGTAATWGSGHTLFLGDGVSSDASSATNGFEVDCYISSARLLLGNVTVQGGSGTNRWAGSSSASANGTFVGGNMAINSGSEFRNVSGGAVLTLGGNLTNNGTYTALTGLTLATVVANTVVSSPNAQLIGGPGIYQNLTVAPTGNFNSLAINNSNATGVSFAALNNLSGAAGFSGASVTVGLTFTAGKVNIAPGNALLWGTSSARGTGTMTVTAGGMAPGSTFAMGTSGVQTGTTISTGSVPTFSSGGYPLIDSSGNSRNGWIQRVTPSGAGIIGMTFNEVAGLSTVSIVDGAYTVNTQYNSSWTLGTFGTSPGSASFTMALSAANAFGATPSLANMRITTASGVLGTHQAGTVLPHSQRTGLSLANLTAQPFYVGLDSADLPFVSAASGDWATPATWNKGAVPTATDAVTIAAGHNVTVSTGAQAALSLALNSTGGLTVSSGSLSVTGAAGSGISNAGTVTVSGGILNLGPQDNSLCNRLFTNASGGTIAVGSGALNIAGRLLVNLGSSFNQTGGDINVDGNAGGVIGNSIAAGTAIIDINPSNLTSVNLTGGTLTLVDPHAGSSTSSYGLLVSGATSGPLNVTSGHTIRFGDGLSIDSGGSSTQGFYVDTWEVTTGMPLGNVVVEGPTGTNRFLSGKYQQPILGNVTVNSGGEFRIATSYINGNITINSGGIFTPLGTLRMGNSTFVDGSFVNFSASTNAQTIGGTGTYRNLTAAPTANFLNLTIDNTNATPVTLLDADKSASGAVTFVAGKLSTGTFSLNMNGGATFSGVGANSFVIGTVAKTYTATGSFLYPVGTGLQYSPVTATVGTLTTNPSTLSVTGFAGTIAGTNSTEKVNRYWSLTETGDLTADLLFDYALSDVTSISSNEAGFDVLRKEGNADIDEYTGTYSIDTTNHNATALAVSSFSRWGVGKVLAPTAASVVLSGRILTADGQGIKNVAVTMTGGNLRQPRYTLTGPFGYYTFEDLNAGETYIVNIGSKRFTFQVPSRVVTVNDNVVDFDFIADPLQ